MVAMETTSTTTDATSVHDEIQTSEAEMDQTHLIEEHKCLDCSKTFPSKVGLIFHLQSHKVSKFKCKKCSKGFQSQKAMRNHKCSPPASKSSSSAPLSSSKSIVNKDILNKCPVCDKKFKQSSRLAKHICQPSPTVKPKKDEFTCPKCQKVFAYKNNLYKHICSTLNISKDIPNNSKTGSPTILNGAFDCTACKRTFKYHKRFVSHTCLNMTV